MTRLDRQSFLGADSDRILATSTVGIVGLGGGGSHEVQQLAHLGVGRYVIVDPDIIELSNSNRLVGGTLADVNCQAPKVQIAERVIRSLLPDAVITTIQDRWETATEQLKSCDIILGAVDSFNARDQLERFCRRFLVPYIDVGMDVHAIGASGYLISGQIIRSVPGEPCMRCCNFINDQVLRREAEQYGEAGSRPQVVWPNGVLASTAVGLAVQMLTPWHAGVHAFQYLSYDGNKGMITPNRWMAELASKECSHFPSFETGDPGFDIRALLTPETSIEVTTSSSATPAGKNLAVYKKADQTMMITTKIVRKLHALDRRTAWAFSPWIPVAVSLIIFIALLWFGDFAGEPARRSSLVAAGGAVMACLGVLAVARPIIRAGGYLAWHEKSKTGDAGSAEPSPEELREEKQERSDALAVNVVGPVLAISGTLINGLSGFFAL